MKELIIVTGPPGAGKSTWIAQHFPDYPCYDENNGNKHLWRDHKGPQPAVLVTSAASHANKSYWLDLSRSFGFAPRLFVIDPGMATTIQQLHRREKTTEARKRRLTTAVRRWYNGYSPHPDEVKVDGRSRVSKASIG